MNRIDATKESEGSTSSEDEYVFTVSETKQSKSEGHLTTTVMVGKENIEFIVDTGATVNLIEESDYSRLENVTLQRTSTKIFPYDSKVPLKIRGKFETVIETREKMTCAEFYVVKKNTKSCGSLICYETAHELGLVTVVNQVHDADPPIPTTLLNEYKEIFSGVGKMKGHQVKLHIDNKVKPVAQPHRRIPFHIRKQVESKLKEMEEMAIIEKVDGPTPWVSPQLLWCQNRIILKKYVYV